VHIVLLINIYRIVINWGLIRESIMPSLQLQVFSDERGDIMRMITVAKINLLVIKIFCDYTLEVSSLFFLSLVGNLVLVA